jgi:hypothetical protein
MATPLRSGTRQEALRTARYARRRRTDLQQAPDRYSVANPRGAATESPLFPLGLTRYKTPAESLLPGHLLTALGPAGHVASVGLLLAAGLGIAILLSGRPATCPRPPGGWPSA